MNRVQRRMEWLAMKWIQLEAEKLTFGRGFSLYSPTWFSGSMWVSSHVECMDEQIFLLVWGVYPLLLFSWLYGIFLDEQLCSRIPAERTLTRLSYRYPL